MAKTIMKDITNKNEWLGTSIPSRGGSKTDAHPRWSSLS